MTGVSPDDWLEIGRIVAPQGLDGSVRVYPDTDFPERFLEPGDRWLQRPGQATPERIQLLSGRYLHGKGLYVVQLAGIQNRNQAEQLRDARLLVDRRDRLPLDPEEFHVADLIGLQVRLHATGKILGTVVDVYAAGNDLLSVELADPENPPAPDAETGAPSPSRKPPVLVPFVYEIVPVVNLEKGYLEIRPPEGLLPES